MPATAHIEGSQVQVTGFVVDPAEVHDDPTEWAFYQDDAEALRDSLNLHSGQIGTTSADTVHVKPCSRSWGDGSEGAWIEGLANVPPRGTPRKEFVLEMSFPEAVAVRDGLNDLYVD